MVIFPRDHLEIWVVHLPVPLTTLTTHPLRSPTCFHRNQNTPQETKLGIVYDFLFLTQKHLTTFLNTTYKNKPKNLFGYSVDHNKGHGQAPQRHPHPQNPHTQPLCSPPRVQCGPPTRGSCNKASSWAASIAVRVTPSPAPAHRVHSRLLCPQDNYCASQSVQESTKCLLLTV